MRWDLRVDKSGGQHGGTVSEEMEELLGRMCL